MKTITKKAAAAEALANDQRHFTWTCDRHGETAHSVGKADCIKCKAEENARNRESRAALKWRTITGGRLPASYRTEQPTLRATYAARPEGYEIDHRVAKIARDWQGNHIASGLHTVCNVGAIPKRLNRKKANYFDPDNFRDQRPANAYPGGAWDPELTEQEWARVELLVRRYGHDRDAAVRDMQAQIARQHTIYLQTNAA
ncbi:hypothetical protein [Burkholderia diffusa]|uniref:Uncharacterized protein n=1 Tax=Burkholderia diffusa TaxID=488732 RepID=A0A6P2M1H6_9BURK|nr:hypothetical protein [Burkholderia diffusa]KAB0657135.1 hypothetical protein F7R23_12110 [Burkholderia diffusa]MBM2655018.1 hypothetical protein [Burkholderia diffusa]VWB75744.1 hypothetical protein BDI24065_03601 [Burkholderia diffusa]